MGVCEAGRVLSSGRLSPPQARRGVSLAVLPGQLMLRRRVRLQLEMEISSQVILRSVCSMALEFSHAQTHQRTPCCRQRGHLDPISLYKGADHEAHRLLCLGWAWASLLSTGGEISSCKGSERTEAALISENFTALVSGPTTTLSGPV